METALMIRFICNWLYRNRRPAKLIIRDDALRRLDNLVNVVTLPAKIIPLSMYSTNIQGFFIYFGYDINQ